MSALVLLPQSVRDQIEECRNPRPGHFPPSGLREDLRAIPEAEAAGWSVRFRDGNWHNGAEFSRDGVSVWWSRCWRAKRDDAPFREEPRLYATLADALAAEG